MGRPSSWKTQPLDFVEVLQLQSYPFSVNTCFQEKTGNENICGSRSLPVSDLTPGTPPKQPGCSKPACAGRQGCMTTGVRQTRLRWREHGHVPDTGTQSCDPCDCSAPSWVFTV